MVEILNKVVYLSDFAEFPMVSQNVNTGALTFNHYSRHKSMKEVNSVRMDYFTQRLAQAEERIFSHVDLYKRATLSDNTNSGSTIRTVYNVHSVLGDNTRKWVLGIISQKEDGFYYIEDGTTDIKITFAELEWVEPDAFFTEMCVVMAEGKYDNGMFYILRVMHPPLH
jgi:DNA polymerase epsilon subunit 2